MLFETLVPSLMNGMLARDLTNEQKAKILENGLYHLTSAESADLIMDDDGVAHFKPSNSISSYSTLGKKSVFMFPEKPSFFDIVRNIKDFSTEDLEQRKFIHIAGKDALAILEQLKYRPMDYATMFPGELEIPAQVLDFETVYKKELESDIKTKFNMIDSLNKAISSTVGNGYKEIYTKIKENLEHKIASYRAGKTFNLGDSKAIEEDYNNSLNYDSGEYLTYEQTKNGEHVFVNENAIFVANYNKKNELDGMQRAIYLNGDVVQKENGVISVNGVDIDINNLNGSEIQNLLHKHKSIQAVEVSAYENGNLHNMSQPAKLLYEVDSKNNYLLQDKLFSFKGTCVNEEFAVKNVSHMTTYTTQKEFLNNEEVLQRGYNEYLEYQEYKSLYDNYPDRQNIAEVRVHDGLHYSIDNDKITSYVLDEKTGETLMTKTFYMDKSVAYDGAGNLFIGGETYDLNNDSLSSIEESLISDKLINSFEYAYYENNYLSSKDYPAALLYELDDDGNIQLSKTCYAVDGKCLPADEISKNAPYIQPYTPTKEPLLMDQLPKKEVDSSLENQKEHDRVSIKSRIKEYSLKGLDFASNVISNIKDRIVEKNELHISNEEFEM